MRSNSVETWLDREGVAYGYVASLALTGFDDKSSLTNQARIGVTLMPELVESYAIAMLDGNEFPAVVCYKGSKGYIVIDGNHRIAAAREAGRAAVDAYVVTNSTPLQIRTLTKLANYYNGERPKQEHAILQAVEHVMETGASVMSTPRLFGISKNTLQVAMRDRRARDRLARAGVNASAVPDRKLEKWVDAIGCGSRGDWRVSWATASGPLRRRNNQRARSGGVGGAASFWAFGPAAGTCG